MSETGTDTVDYSGFDFLIGDWNIHNRRLTSLFSGSDTWDEFASTASIRPLLDGAANIEQIDCPERGWSGLTFRLYDHIENRWSLTWVNGSTGRPLQPVFGVFTGAAGDFYGVDEIDGLPIRVHFLWRRTDTESPRWSQEFSRDGTTWETNWSTDFTRRIE